MATNLADEESYRLLRADDLRHLQLLEAPRRLVVCLPGGPGEWTPIVDGGPGPSVFRFSGVVDRPVFRPVLPAHFHLRLVEALEAARVRAIGERRLQVVQAAHDGTVWQWHTDTWGAALARIDARTRIEAPDDVEPTARETVPAF
ncbi:hypothetical protein ACSCBZ_46800 [Streptomyces niveiscabiei]|uniref:hypothetical protein n=1 Tax=Streptomyces niveiscabiei TaxID=164115 RepID=UPI0006EB881C|nr:hypothetical protein [Streptomyces niveiscabiei]